MSLPPPIKVPVEEANGTAPSMEVKQVGVYVALNHWVSVLLQRQGEAYPWAVLRPESKVSTAYTLVSLPGYRSLLDLDAGLRLTLWGNLPEFSPFPPVLESAVMLHAPAVGFDLDFTLDRGRAIVANSKPSGPARVRVRFLREVWEMDLQDAKSEVGLELWALPRGAATTSPGSYLCLGLFTKGRVQVRTPRQTMDLGDHSRLSWVSQDPDELHRSLLPELPKWWAHPPENKSPEVQKALGSLLDWSDQLGGSGTEPVNNKQPVKGDAPIIATIKTQVEEGMKDPDNQDMGILFLAALDQLVPLVQLLKDRQNPSVRGVTLYALQSWLGRDGRHAGKLAQVLQEGGDSKDESERIVRLLQFYSPEDLDKAKTYEALINCLDDDKLLVRDLAFWQLDRIGEGGRLPEDVKEIVYDPTMDREKRQPAIAQWKKLLADGKIPLPAPK